MKLNEYPRVRVEGRVPDSKPNNREWSKIGHRRANRHLRASHRPRPVDCGSSTTYCCLFDRGNRCATGIGRFSIRSDGPGRLRPACCARGTQSPSHRRKPSCSMAVSSNRNQMTCYKLSRTYFKNQKKKMKALKCFI